MITTFLISFILLFVSFSNIYVFAEEIEFGYTGKKGPDFWHLLSEESEICQSGKRQSPIDINSEDLKTLATPPHPMFGDAEKVKSINNGNTVEICSGHEGVPLPATINIDGEMYELQQFHFHTPSEHRINGRHHDIEQHLVFQSKDEKISVVAVFYDVGKEDSKFMVPIIDNLPKEIGYEKDIEKVELANLLTDIKNMTEAFTYSGSLTTPPCTEGVTWYVNKNAQEISTHQFSELRNVIGFNSRFTQLRADDQVEVVTPSETNNNVTSELPPTYEVVPPTEPSEPQPYKKRRSLYRRSHFNHSK